MTAQQGRVLHVAPTPFFADRGCHIRIRGIVAGLAERGFDNRVCTYPIGRDVDGVQTIRCPAIPGYTRTEAGPSGYKYLADLLLIGTVTRTIRRYRPDVLHCHLHEGVLIGWLAKWLALRPNIPLVFDMQGSLVGELEAHDYFRGRRWLMRVFRWLESMIVARADVSVCSSDASVRALVDSFEVDPAAVFLAPDGADVTGQQSGSPPMVLPADGRTVVVYSGGLSDAKGLPVLAETIRSARQRGLPAYFLIVGYPTEALEAYLAEHGLASDCRLAGQVPFDELGGYLDLATIALEPKPSGSGEASGKLVNYMAAGLAVVCFDTPNNRNMLDGNGFFASGDSADAFVDALEAAIYNPGRVARIGAAGSESVRNKFSWTATAGQVQAAYVKAGVGRTSVGQSGSEEK